ncbi:MAG: N-6 DNA methylase [Thiohalocapsa sp.]
MLVVRDYEAERLQIQDTLDALKTPEERNRLGQFATPTAFARDILQHAKDLMPGHAKVRFMDPAIGTGSFFSALLNVFPEDQIAAATGFEIDPAFANAARGLWEGKGLELVGEDFTKAQAPRAEKDRFNLVICNPPYVRHHHIINGEKARLHSLAKEASGAALSGLSGLYCYFLCLSRVWMTNKGLAGWLIPSEFMDVNYGLPVKRYLLEKVTLEQIHRFDPNDVQFDDSLVSSAVVWFRKAKPAPGHEVLFTYGGSLSDPHITRRVSLEVLRREPKWTRFPRLEARENFSGLTLKDFFTIKRGLATGDNKFFVLDAEQIRERGLPRECFRPILPSPRFLKTEEVCTDENGVPLIERPLFLLDSRLPEDEIKERFPALSAYLREGKEKGVTDRYLCRHRSPWYAQENREASSFVCTYIGRSDKKGRRPFRFILNHSQATVANSYLVLYPKALLQRALSETPSLKNDIWKVLNGISAQSMLDEGRVYGGGLHKMEPKELGNVPADALADLMKISHSEGKQKDLYGVLP